MMSYYVAGGLLLLTHRRGDEGHAGTETVNHATEPVSRSQDELPPFEICSSSLLGQ